MTKLGCRQCKHPAHRPLPCEHDLCLCPASITSLSDAIAALTWVLDQPTLSVLPDTRADLVRYRDRLVAEAKHQKRMIS